MSLDFLFASWGNPGNLNPMLTAATRLRDRGHRVRFIDEAYHQQEIANAGFAGAAWQRPAPLTPPAPGDDHPFWTEIHALLEQMMFGGASDYAADTMDALRSERADVVVTNDLLAGPAVAAEALGIPYALLSPHISVRPLDGVPACVTGLIPDGSDAYRLAERAVRERLTATFSDYLPVLNRARGAYGLAPLQHIYDHYDRADRVLIGMSEAFDFTATRLPANLRYVGPLLNMPQWAQAWDAPWSRAAVRPRVLVSLSTSFQNQAGLLRRIIAALGTMDLDAVVTIGPAMAKETFVAPSNICIMEGAPHDVLMKQVSMVVTHAGHGTVARSLLNGVPMLVIPMGRDQHDNAVRVVSRGAGLRIADSAEEDEIAAAIGRLVTEPQFRAAARRLSQAMAADVGSPVLETELEDIAQRRWRHSA